MSSEKFQNKYRIKSARANWHDYSGGAYFITVCTKNHEYFFGEIINNGEAEIHLSSIGQFLCENIQNVTEHYPYAEIPLFVIMPNHWHAVVYIDGNKTPYIRGNKNNANVGNPVETWRAASQSKNGYASQSKNDTQETRHATSLLGTAKNDQMQDIANKQGWLSVAIGGIKSAVTKFANENNINFAWQTRFHDHIIRNQDEMNRIADYIENNPARWDADCFNKNNKR